MQIDWDSIPKYVINLAKIDDPYDICEIFKHYKIDKYLYKIQYKGIVIKFGMSADKSRNFGDRAYRQIGHMSSWPKDVRLTGSSGADWRVIEEDFLNTYGFQIEHQSATLTVWDVTNYDFKSINSRNEILDMEAQLIESYRQAVGEKPIGNINDEANRLNRPYTSKAVMGHLFENPEDYLV